MMITLSDYIQEASKCKSFLGLDHDTKNGLPFPTITIFVSHDFNPIELIEMKSSIDLKKPMIQVVSYRIKTLN